MEEKLYYSFRKVLLDKLNNGKPMAERVTRVLLLEAPDWARRESRFYIWG